MQKRIQSPILWVSCAALFSFVMKNWFGWEIPKFDEFVDLLLAVLVAFGVVNNPTNKEGF